MKRTARLTAACLALAMMIGTAACGLTGAENSGETTTTAAKSTTTTTAKETETTTTTAKETETTTAKETEAPESEGETETTTKKSSSIPEIEYVEIDGVMHISQEVLDKQVNKPFAPEKVGAGRAAYISCCFDGEVKIYDRTRTDECYITGYLTFATDCTVYAVTDLPEEECIRFVYVEAGDIKGWIENYQCIKYVDEDPTQYELMKDLQLPDKNNMYSSNQYILADSVEIKKAPSDDAETVTAIGIDDFMNYPYREFESIVVFTDRDDGWYFLSKYIDGLTYFGWINKYNGTDYYNICTKQEFNEQYEALYGEKPTFKRAKNDKPAVYLYPEKETKVDIKLDMYNAELKTTYPKYDNGWSVTATPEGKIKDNDGYTYDYIFWDSVDYNTYDMSRGYCVKGEDTVDFLREKLTYIGLNEAEMNEFIVYWLPKMEQNEYNIITFHTDDYAKNYPMTISPEPDSVLRLMMTYKAADEYTEIEPQQLTHFERRGFTVVEWGGQQR